MSAQTAPKKASQKRRLTEQEFLALPEDERKYELVCGEVHEVPVGVKHDVIGTDRKAQRRVPYSWGFHQLGSFIEYKARLAGVPVVCVDPRNRACPACGHVSKVNRPTPAEFRYVGCGFAG